MSSDDPTVPSAQSITAMIATRKYSPKAIFCVGAAAIGVGFVAGIAISVIAIAESVDEDLKNKGVDDPQPNEDTPEPSA